MAMKLHCAREVSKIRLFQSCCFLHCSVRQRWLCVEEGEITIRELAKSLSKFPNTKRWFFFSAACEKKQCKYCHFYSLCKLPEVMQAKLEFSSHHCSLYLAIHAQTFVDLEICGWFSNESSLRSILSGQSGGIEHHLFGCNCLTWWTLYHMLGRLPSPSESLCNL